MTHNTENEPQHRKRMNEWKKKKVPNNNNKNEEENERYEVRIEVREPKCGSLVWCASLVIIWLLFFFYFCSNCVHLIWTRILRSHLMNDCTPAVYTCKHMWFLLIKCSRGFSETNGDRKTARDFFEHQYHSIDSIWVSSRF